MGGLTSLASQIDVITQGIGLVQNVVGSEVSASQQSDEQSLALQQLQAQQTLNQQQLAQNNALERESIAAAAAIDTAERQDALRRAVARQRAQFGSSGISQGSGGSSQAVLLGLFDETETDISNREALDNLRTRALDLGASQQSSVNILQREQLQQSQRLSNATSDFDNINNGINTVTGILF